VKRGQNAVAFAPHFANAGVDESSGSCTFMLNEEVKDVQALCRWIRSNPNGLFGAAPSADAPKPTSYAAAAAAGATSGDTKSEITTQTGTCPSGHRIVIVGDSAGAPVAGSAIGEEGVVGYVCTPPYPMNPPTQPYFILQVCEHGVSLRLVGQHPVFSTCATNAASGSAQAVHAGVVRWLHCARHPERSSQGLRWGRE